MRMKKPAVVLATAAMMTLAACGVEAAGTVTRTRPTTRTFQEGGNAGAFKNPDAEAPMEVLSDATEGGTLTVLTAVAPSTLDPTQAYYTDSTAIPSDLVTRGSRSTRTTKSPTTCS